MLSRQDIDEAVALEDYDPDWPRMFEAEADLLRPVFGKRLLDIQHYGSTAVPGIKAKPVIDILVGLPAAELSAMEIRELMSLGYEYFGEAGVAGRLYLRKRGEAKSNISVVQHQSELWKDNIAFRDFLRADPLARERYVQAKVSALSGGASRLLAYSEGKSSTIAELILEARKHLG